MAEHAHPPELAPAFSLGQKWLSQPEIRQMKLATGFPSVLCVTGRLSTDGYSDRGRRLVVEDNDVWKAPPIEDSTD